MPDRGAKLYPEHADAGDKPREPETVRPPFDPEEFARESDSLIRIEAAETVPPPAMSTPRGGTSGTMTALAAVGPELVPSLALSRDDLEWFDLEPVARVLLRYVTGGEPVEAIARNAGVSLEQAVAVLHELAREGILTWQE